METRNMTLPVFLETKKDRASYKIQVPNFFESGIDIRFSMHIEESDSVFYIQDLLEGALLFQEYWIGKDKFYFDMNEDGELIAICPEGWDVMIGPEGDLIVYPEGHRFEGIGFWIIEDNFVVQ